MQSSFTSKMYCDQNNDWTYLPVETADEVMSCGEMIECASLANWNRWLKIRKRQHRRLGLMVCRSATSLLMNKSDRYRSTVECKWMINLAQKLKINNEYTRSPPYPIHKEIQNFTSVCIPDVIRTEKGMSGDIRDDFEMHTANVSLHNEFRTLTYLRPAKSPEKLAVVGRNVFDGIIESKGYYKGTLPSICVERAREDEERDNESAVIIVRINDFTTKSYSSCNNGECETFALRTKSINPVRIGEDCWDEIIVENRGEISIHYKWEKLERPATKYDDILKERPTERFYFDTRTGILGPGQIKRLKVLFRPKVVGLNRDTWLFRVEILGKLDPIVRINVPLQGCAIARIDDKAITTEIKKIVELKTFCSDLAKTIVRNIFPKRDDCVFGENYLYNEHKMKDLYRVTRTEKPLDINELLSQCMRLERSFREKFLNAISRTAVTLVNENIFYESGGHVNRYELKNAYKTMYVAIDCIDLMLNAYKPDYDEVLQELQDTKLMAKNDNNNATSAAENVVASKTNIAADYGVIREEWLDTMRPMIHKRLEWAVEKLIVDHGIAMRQRQQHRVKYTSKHGTVADDATMDLLCDE